MAVSQTRLESIERWQPVKETDANPPREELSVQGELTRGDEFRVYFTIQMEQFPRGPTPSEIGVIVMNLTKPSGNIVHLPDTLIGMYQGYPYPLELPKGIVNATGTYQVDAKSIGWLSLTSLRLERFGIEGKEPFSFLLPFSAPVSIMGMALSIFGAKSSKRKERKLRSRKQRSQ